MLYFIAMWICLTIACWLTGTAILNGLNADRFQRIGDRYIVSLWLGIIMLAISLLATALIVPISPVVGGGVILGLSGVSCILPRTRAALTTLYSTLSPNLCIGVLTLAVTIATFMTRQVTWIDTGLYHYGAIRWLSEFGVVPGLALLSKQFGFISAWFALSAPLNPVSLGGRGCAVLNGFVLLVTVLHGFISASYIVRNKAQLHDWFMLVFVGLIVPAMVLGNFISIVLVSASPDIPVILLTGAIAWTLLVISNFKCAVTLTKHFVFDDTLIPVILSIGAVSIKLTALPLLLISSLFYVFHRGFHWRKVLMGSVIVFMLLLPMTSFSVITSGCPLYPSSLLCLDVPWALTAEEARNQFEKTRGWGTWFGSVPSQVGAGLWLFWQWFNSIGASKWIVLLIIVSILAVVYVIRNAIVAGNDGQLWLAALAMVGTTFMMVNSPLLRFGMGYVFLLPAMAIAILGHVFLQRLIPWLQEKLMYFYSIRQVNTTILWSLLFLSTLITVGNVSRTLPSRWLIPPPLPETSVIQQTRNNVTYFSPQNDNQTCWASQLPCATSPINTIQLRHPSNGIRAGFVRKDDRAN